jgi:hypothetical protein
MTRIRRAMESLAFSSRRISESLPQMKLLGIAAQAVNDDNVSRLQVFSGPRRAQCRVMTDDPECMEKD